MDFLIQQFIVHAKKIREELQRIADELHEQTKATQEHEAPLIVEQQPLQSFTNFMFWTPQ